jgi:hypothetical protein
VVFVSITSSSKQASLDFAPFFCRAYVRGTETIFTGNRTQETFYGVSVFVSAISSLKQTILPQTPFSYRS